MTITSGAGHDVVLGEFNALPNAGLTFNNVPAWAQDDYLDLILAFPGEAQLADRIAIWESTWATASATFSFRVVPGTYQLLLWFADQRAGALVSFGNQTVNAGNATMSLPAIAEPASGQVLPRGLMLQDEPSRVERSRRQIQERDSLPLRMRMRYEEWTQTTERLTRRHNVWVQPAESLALRFDGWIQPTEMLPRFGGRMLPTERMVPSGDIQAMPLRRTFDLHLVPQGILR